MKFIDCCTFIIYYGRFIVFAKFDAIFIKINVISKQTA
ncbi:hypothetical protein M2273_003308 [Mucilaginibacter lappiensis]